MEWLQALPQPIHGCYEAGPTGYALYRAAEAAGLRVDVVAPSKTPRAAADRVKTDRKDAELLVRLLLAGSLSVVAVPPRASRRPAISRARVSRCGPISLVCATASRSCCCATGASTTAAAPGRAHRRWLAGQRFEHVPTELAYLDALAAIDGLLARRAALDERLSLLASEPEHWPTVARLRCFRGIETLSALVSASRGRRLRPLPTARQLAAWLGLVPSLHQSGESETRGSITKTGSGFARRILVEAAWHYLREPRIGVSLPTATPASPTTSSRSPGGHNTASTVSTAAARTRQARQHRRRRRRPRARLLPLGGSRRRLIPTAAARGEEGAGAKAAGTRETPMGSPPRRRPFLDSAGRRRRSALG